MANEILKEEIMNEEQLENVVGGTRGQLSCDTKFLHALGVMDHYYEPYYCEKHMSEVASEINSALQKAGFRELRIDTSVSGGNTYYFRKGEYTGVLVAPREEIYGEICDKLGKTDFDYKKFL